MSNPYVHHVIPISVMIAFVCSNAKYPRGIKWEGTVTLEPL